MTKVKLTSIFLTILLATNLIACGGGGSSSQNNADSTTSTLNRDVTLQNIEDVAILDGITTINGNVTIKNISFTPFDLLLSLIPISEHTTPY